MTRYLFSSHDGYGLGHTRRNALIASSVLADDPDAEITLVTGLAVRPSWSIDARIRMVRVPSLLKDSAGAYCNDSMSFEDAIRVREQVFAELVTTIEPDVVVVDRHPFGIAGELRRGLELARNQGARVFLGLRDILDEPDRVAEEFAGQGWAGVADLYEQALVYGGRVLCDHAVEYGLPLTATYCGWVVDHPVASARDGQLLVVSAGGGGDGADVFRLGLDVLNRLPAHRGAIIAGPYAAAMLEQGTVCPDRVSLIRDAPGCANWFARAGAVMLMAGYNSTFEALAAGLRPVLVPRRSPRREQAIRATRLAALGLADVVDEGAAADEVAWLLRRPRYVAADELRSAGIELNGAERAAALIAARQPASALLPALLPALSPVR